MLASIMNYFDVSTCLFGALIILVLTLYFRSNQPKNLPPTPGLALPFIGHLYMLEKNPRQQFKHWADKHGDVFRLQMGPETVVVVNTFEAMKEAFVKKADHFSDRAPAPFLEIHSPDFLNGIVSTSGAKWKAQRTTSLSILRNFGMGKNILAEKISEEVSCFIKELEAKNGQASDIGYITNLSVSNVICSIIFGKKFQYDDTHFISIIEKMNQFFNIISGVAIFNYMPNLYYLPFDFFKAKKLLKVDTEIWLFINDMIDKIVKDYDPDNLDNFIVAYVDEMKREKQSSEEHYLDELNLNRNIQNLFFAGTETTSTTILWCLLYVLNYPTVQNKIFDEIVEHVGTMRSPNMADKPKLKYLAAFIMEVQRKASIAPLSLPHKCNTESTIAGYTIPKGATVLPNLDAVLSSQEIWGDPENFRPERFLDEQGNIVTREEWIPFSIGRRVCLGESLAKMELFLYLSTLFQKFEFLPPSPDDVPPLQECTFGISLSPQHFQIKCVLRN